MNKLGKFSVAAVFFSLAAFSQSSTQAAPKPGAREAGGKRPIIDTHLHLYQVTAPGGIPWP